MRRSALVAACAVLVWVFGACGAERARKPKSAVEPGDRFHRISYPLSGLSLSLPVEASVERRRYPGVLRASVGESFIAVFAYRRREQIPRRAGELGAARRRLVAQVRRRSRRFRLIRSRVIRVARAPAIQLLGDQTISRSRLRTRSLHVFKGRGEYVIDMLAPVDRFRATNRVFFSPAARSLKVTGRIKRPPPRKRRKRR
jgi:hypothetical protein